LPECALKHYFESISDYAIDLVNLETCIADLSHAIVIFPEAAGSYVETGYFSAMPNIAEKIVLALDVKFQADCSFISLGPAKMINDVSRFDGVVQVSYKEPNFSDIVRRLKKFKVPQIKQKLELKEFKNLPTYQRFCLISKIFDILSPATIDDILFMLRGLFHNRINETEIVELIYILIGAKYIRSVGEYGQYIRGHMPELLFLRDGFASEDRKIRLELTCLYESKGREFQHALEARGDAA
jgi:hypothetical protein